MGDRGININSKFLGQSNWKAGDSHCLKWAGDGWELGEVWVLGFGYV